MISFNIDGNNIEVEEGISILQAAEELEIKIPTLCYHPGLEAIGACRLCVVEISKPEWNGHVKLEPSCLTTVEEGLIVNTKSPLVREKRKMLLNMLLARVPNSEVIRQLADEYGLGETSFTVREDADNCILCSICVRICEAIGVNAIAPLYRGLERIVDVPRTDNCIGCLACALNCPTNAIHFEEANGKRRIWNKEFNLVSCWSSGETIGTLEQIWHFAKRSGLPIETFLKSDKVREKESAAESVGVKL